MKSILLAGLLCLTGATMGQDRVDAELAVPDAGVRGTDAQIAVNAARIMDLREIESTRTFVLQLISAIGTLVLGGLTLMVRHKLNVVATSVDGMKTELVAVTLAKGKLEGANTEQAAQAKRTSKRAKKAKP